MINANEFWISLQNLGNFWRTGFLSPSKANDYANQASLEIFNEKYLAYLQSNKIDDDLSPFHLSANLPVDVPVGFNYGLVTFPSDYNYYGVMRAFFTGKEGEMVSCGCPTSDNKACDAKENLLQTPVSIYQIPIVKEVRVTKVSAGEWDSVLNHRTKYPTIDRPYCTEYKGGFKVAPRNLSIITFDYFKQPINFVFGYTALPSGYFQYDAATSVNFEWGSQVKNELIDRTLKLFSVQVKNPALFQAADNLKQTRV